jgi:hypothetical protein
MSTKLIFSRFLLIIDFILPLIWALCLIIFLVIQFAFDLQQNFGVKLGFGILTSVIGWRFLYLWFGAHKSVEEGKKGEAIIMSLIWSLAVFAMMIAFSALFGEVLKTMSLKQFKEQRLAFNKNPNEFPFIRDFAKQHFGLDVVLGGVNDAWSNTSLTLDIPGTSPASMAYSTGHCILNIHKMQTAASFTPKNPQDEDAFLKGVLIHEFGHCLDVTRDAPNYGASSYQTKSFAPVDAVNVKDAQSFSDTSASEQTQLWREVFSDVMLVGYWRLANPTRAQQLSEEWSQIRLKYKVDNKDTIHYTSCWLTEIKTVADPKDFASLREWSDQQRKAFYEKCTHKA